MVKWFILLPLNIIVTALALLLAPVLPLFASKDGYLPKWLSWFQTPDNPLYGDERFIKTHKDSYWTRCLWLWRNSAYGWAWNVLAFKVQDGYTIRVIAGKKPVEGSLKSDGFYFAKLTNPDGSSCWQLYITHHWSKTHCTKLNFGYKIWMASEIKEGMLYPICAYTFNPVQWIKAI